MGVRTFHDAGVQLSALVMEPNYIIRSPCQFSGIRHRVRCGGHSERITGNSEVDLALADFTGVIRMVTSEHRRQTVNMAL